MSSEQVRDAFAKALDLPPDADIEALEIGKDARWDSIGHMALVAELEARFGIELDTGDIIAMNSYAASMQVLRRYGVDVPVV